MALCLRPTSSRWHEPISVYREDFTGEIPTKKLEKNVKFEVVPKSVYVVDYTGETRPQVRYTDLLLYQSAEQRRKSNYVPSKPKFSKQRGKPPLDNLPVLRKDPNKPPVKIDLPDVAPKPGFRPDEKRRGQPWPYPNLLAKSKFPDIDMYTIDKLAHKYRWTTTTGHQLEEAALPVPEIDPARKTFEKKADPVRAEIQRYYPGPQEFQKAEMLDRHLLREPVPAALPLVETRDPKPRLLKQRLGTEKDNKIAEEKEKLQKVEKLVEQCLVSDLYLPRTPKYAGYRPMEPATGILKPDKPPPCEMQSVYTISYRPLLPSDGSSGSGNFKRTAPISSCVTIVYPHNPFRSLKDEYEKIKFTYTRDMFSSKDSFDEYLKTLPTPERTPSVVTTNTASSFSVSSTIFSSGLDLPLPSQATIRKKNMLGTD